MKRSPAKARLAMLVRIAISLAVLSSTLYAQSDDEKTTPRMKEMAAVIDGVQLQVTSKGRKEDAKRIEHALLRTIETTKNAVGRSEDGSLWLFEHGGVPVAIVELWATSGSHNWGHTLLAVTSDRLGGTAGSSRWSPQPNSGVTFKRLPKTSSPSAKSRLRQVQMRQIARRFKTNIEDPGRNDKQQFRLLSEPIHRYKGGDVDDGGIFAFVRGESNAEVLLFLQAKDGNWEYGLLRCSSNELVARLDRSEVWRAEQIPGWVGAADEPFWVVHRPFVPELADGSR